MTWNKNTINESPGDSWGGPWTEKKLDAFENYVIAYLTIMKRNPYWETIYFDGFAGSGEKGDEQNPLYLKLEFSEFEEHVYEGAAERISKMGPEYRFNYYYFNEKNELSLTKLKNKILTLNHGKEGKLEFRAGDCNGEFVEIGNRIEKTKSPTSKALKYAALIFLDPFGMQVEWDAIEQLTETKSDVWILLPTAVIVNRLLDKRGELKSIKKLESFFGMSEDEIRGHFFIQTGQQNLFEKEVNHFSKVANPIEKIAEIYIAKMKTIWTHVTERPLRLNNRSGAPLFHFVFASNNPNALKIANDIIKNI